MVLGLGPGSPDYMSPRAREALAQAEVIVGYRGYIDLVEPELLRGKEIVSTAMTGEMDRCTQAIARSLQGKDTAVVCSGDPGIYGMAGLILELLEERGLLEEMDLEVIPGVPALAAAASLLGAPLMHDFACVSLSDLLTPWEVIEQRVAAALQADFVLVLYNPRSTRRKWQLPRILDMVRGLRGEATPVGVVRNAMRQGQRVTACTAAELDPASVDMLSIVLVGNSTTRLCSGKLITPRGYLEKYGSRTREKRGTCK